MAQKCFIHLHSRVLYKCKINMKAIRKDLSPINFIQIINKKYEKYTYLHVYIAYMHNIKYACNKFFMFNLSLLMMRKFINFNKMITLNDGCYSCSKHFCY